MYKVYCDKCKLELNDSTVNIHNEVYKIIISSNRMTYNFENYTDNSLEIVLCKECNDMLCDKLRSIVKEYSIDNLLYFNGK